jgi:hypothetical protein
MRDPHDRLVRNYQPAFLAFLGQPDEAHLHAAYELGREALVGGVSLLDLVRAHHAALGELLLDRAADRAAGLLDGAASFLIEAMAPFEMARRGYLETTAAPDSGREDVKPPHAERRRSRRRPRRSSTPDTGGVERGGAPPP